MNSQIKLNIILVFTIVILSILTIYWHHQNYLLYLQEKKVEANNYQLIALRTQLLTDQSSVTNNIEIKKQALKLLKMQPPKTQKELDL